MKDRGVLSGTSPADQPKEYKVKKSSILTPVVPWYYQHCLGEDKMTENNMTWHGTTILSVRKNGEVVVAGDGQVTFGNTVITVSYTHLTLPTI